MPVGSLAVAGDGLPCLPRVPCHARTQTRTPRRTPESRPRGEPVGLLPLLEVPRGGGGSRGGRIFTGANVENASYGLTICAERTAAFAAVLAGASRIEAVAISCADIPEGADPSLAMPCGACRQVLAEFAGPETPIVVDRAGIFTLVELLPMAFRLRAGCP